MATATMSIRKSTNVRVKASNIMRRAGLGLYGRLLPGRASALLERLFLTPSRRDPAAYKRPPFIGARVDRLPYAGRWLRAWSWGEGPAVLLVHGWSGHAPQLAAFVEPLVEAGYSVVAFDAPAHGRSDGERTDMVDFAGAIIQVAGRFGPFHAIVAHSFGAPAAALAIEAGVPARRLVCIAPPVSLEGYSRLVARFIGLPDAVRRRMQRRLETRFGLKWRELNTDRMLARAAERRGLAVLVVHDKRDREVPWRFGARVAQEVPGARLISTDRLGHNRILADPGIAAAVRDFVAGADEPNSSSTRREGAIG